MHDLFTNQIIIRLIKIDFYARWILGGVGLVVCLVCGVIYIILKIKQNKKDKKNKEK